MRTLFFLFCCGSFIITFAQVDDGTSFCNTSYFQSIDFTQPLFAIDSLKGSDNAKTAVSYAKKPINPDLADVEYQKRLIAMNPDRYDEDCHDNLTTCVGDASALNYYVYYPSPTSFNYDVCKAPAVILFHGGGFADCAASFDAPDLQYMCREFAKRGYVAFDVEYRRGRYVDPTKVFFTV